MASNQTGVCENEVLLKTARGRKGSYIFIHYSLRTDSVRLLLVLICLVFPTDHSYAPNFEGRENILLWACSSVLAPVHPYVLRSHVTRFRPLLCLEPCMLAYEKLADPYFISFLSESSWWS